MRKLILVLPVLAAVSVPAFAGGGMFGVGGGAPEIDANTAATAVALLAGWAAVIRGRWRNRRNSAAEDLINTDKTVVHNKLPEEDDVCGR